MAKQKKKWKKYLAVGAFVLLNVAVIAWTATSEFGGGEDAAKFEDIKLKWWLLVPAAICFLVAQGAEIYKYLVALRETWVGKKFDKKEGWRIAKNTVLLGRYYDNITPAAVGGQPFQIFYMNKSGVEGGFGTAIPLMGMITDQMAFLMVGMLAIIIGSFAGWITSPAIVAAGWIGLLCYAFFPMVIMLATFLPQATDEVIGIGVKLLGKIKIIKEPEEAREKAQKSVRQYADCIKTFLKTKGLLSKSLLLSVVNYVGMMMIPFFVLRAFGAEVNVVVTFATMAAVSAAVYFIPTPGNAGAAEGVFYSVFSALPSSGYVFWAMLFWRFFAYYLYLIIGLILQLTIYAKDRKTLLDWDKSIEKAEEEAKKRAKNV